MIWPADILRLVPSGAWVLGVDEVGRGPLAGPVVTAAVVLDPALELDGLADSKALSARRREALVPQIRAGAAAAALGRAEVEEIDRLNILGATLLAMQRAVAGALASLPSGHPPVVALVDGHRLPALPVPAQAVVKGDARVPAIAAAAVLAKVARDAELVALERHYPGYGLAQHKGYPTRDHLAALRERGATAVHRRSFAPVAAVLEPSDG